MSLLMDALKKAEEEKKRAANQNKVSADDNNESIDNDSSAEELTPEQVAERASTTDKLELTLAPLDNAADDELPIKEDDEPAQEISATDAVLDITVQEKEESDKTLVDDYSFSEDLTAEHSIASDLSNVDLEETREADDLNSTTILQDLSLAEASSAPFDDTFHGVVLDDEENAYEETLPGVPADQLIKDLGGSIYQSTPVAAQTVISAAKKKSRPSTFKWGVLSILILLAISSFGVFYYFSITPVARQIPSPVVARGIESTPTTLPAIPEVERENVSATLIDQQSIATQQVAESLKNKVSEFLGEPEIAIEKTDTEIVDAQVAEPSTAIEDSELVDTPEEIDDYSVVGSSDDSNQTTNVNTVSKNQEAAINTLPEYLQLDQKAVAITKDAQFEKKSLLVNQAYNAYQQGNFSLAKSMYQDVLSMQNDNRDAHLGLAVIAIRESDPAAAVVHYNSVLSLNPDDAIALTGIQSLIQNRDPVRDESLIKLLLQKEGEQAYLYFALGNSFAKQQRWPEAQQAYFDAHRLDDGNSEYAMNLAISLDHLAQYTSALEFYRRALSLSSSSATAFDIASIQQRINALENLASN
ncbi:MAG: tetratricopeptide repeat protein [Pseudomonadota bacterium]